MAGNFDGNAFVEISGGIGGGGSTDRIEFDAQGTTGEEIVNLLVDGQVVQTFGLFRDEVTFVFDTNDPNVSIEDIRLEFVNDLFDASTGLDRNVLISEFRVIDGDTEAVQSARTTDANVLSSGIFADGGITQGFGAGGFLAGNFDGNAFVEISDSFGAPDVGDDTGAGVTAIQLDPTFQISESFSARPAISPADQIASTNGTEIQVVGSDGVPLSSFGGDGQVDLADLLNINELGQQLGHETTVFFITDLEFFDDGSLLALSLIHI